VAIENLDWMLHGLTMQLPAVKSPQRLEAVSFILLADLKVLVGTWLLNSHDALHTELLLIQSARGSVHSF
jgi:hypothetical protein